MAIDHIYKILKMLNIARSWFSASIWKHIKLTTIHFEKNLSASKLYCKISEERGDISIISCDLL